MLQNTCSDTKAKLLIAIICDDEARLFLRLSEVLKKSRESSLLDVNIRESNAETAVRALVVRPQ